MITILIIDDNTSQANYFAGFLEKENYKIQIAKTSEEADDLLENCNLSLVILNSQMSDNFSLTILNKIRKIFSQNELPVVTIIEKANTQLEEQFLESGTNCIINLPITEISLKLRIDSLLQIRENAVRLKLQINQQKNIFENSPIPSLLIDETGIVKDVNKAAFNLFKIETGINFGIYSGEIFNCYNALHNIGQCGKMAVCSGCLIRGSIDKSFQTKKNTSIREDIFKIFINNELQERTIIATSTYITDISTNLTLLTFEDVTDLRKSQQIIAQKNIELSEKNIELQSQTEELTQISDRLKETNNKLKDSEEFFHTIFNNAYDGMLLGDAETKQFVIGNDMICRMLGYNIGELVNLSVSDIHPVADLPAIIELFEKQARKEIQIIENIQVKRKDGSIFFADINSTPLTINGKNYLLGIFRDISERKQNTEALAEFNQFTTQIIQSAQEGIIVYDNNMNYKVWNPFMERITGLSASQVLGKHPLEYFPFLQEAGLIENYKKALNGEIITAPDFSYHIPNTEIKGWASETSAPLRNIKGEIIGIIATVNDITERKENEKRLKEQTEEIETQIEEYQQLNEELHDTNIELSLAKEQAEESETKYKELFDKNSDNITIFRINPNGIPSNILEMNHRVSQLTGYSKEEILNMTANDFEVNPTLEKIQKRIEDIQSKGFTHFETIIRHKDGYDIPVEVKAVVINYKNQPALMNILRGISERKQAEIKISKQNNELQELNATKDKFMSILAHDLKNPFNSLLGFSELLLKNHTKYDDQKRENQIKSIYNTSKNTFKLLENLLTWARSQSNKISLNKEKINLKYLARQIFMLFSEPELNKKINMLNTITTDIFVVADRNMIETIIRNLFSNSIKYTKENGTILLSADLKNEYVEISISDNGIGMDEKTKNTLFKIGETKSTTGTEGETGTGLGLILCKEFVEKNGGKIWVETEIGKGSDFKFTLPLH